MKILVDYYNPTPNKYAEWYKFHKRIQLDSEGIPKYCVKLKKMTKFCNFPTNWLQEALITQLIVEIESEGVRVKLMEEGSKALEKAIAIASTYSITKLAANINRDTITRKI